MNSSLIEEESVPLNNNSEILLNKSVYAFGEDVTMDIEVVPKWTVHLFLAMLTCGTLLNSTVILTLIRMKKNGTLCLILQMAAVDLLTVFVATIEVIVSSQNDWVFSSAVCQIYKGTSILVNTIIIYLLICLNFHIISLWNLHKLERINKKNPLTSNIEESDECLVTKQENANRVINIDYRKRKSDLSVFIPSITIWFLSISLSLPTFVLSSTVRVSEKYTVCEVVDLFHAKTLHNLMIIFKVFIPTVLLLITLVFLLYKIFKTSQLDIDNAILKKLKETKTVLIICTVLTVAYMITSFQRYCLKLMNVYTPIVSYSAGTNLDLTLLHRDFITPETQTYLSMLHYSGTLFRSILFLYMVPPIWNFIKRYILHCRKTDE